MFDGEARNEYSQILYCSHKSLIEFLNNEFLHELRKYKIEQI